jgi:hypothetical protein
MRLFMDDQDLPVSAEASQVQSPRARKLASISTTRESGSN